MSLRLPAFVAALSDPKMKVRQTTARRNYLHSVELETTEGPYHIFFEISRSRQANRRDYDLDLVVESAYLQGGAKAPATLQPIEFVLLAGKVYLGEPVTTKR